MHQKINFYVGALCVASFGIAASLLIINVAHKEHYSLAASLELMETTQPLK